jgi:hypothetical protein
VTGELVTDELAGRDTAPRFVAEWENGRREPLGPSTNDGWYFDAMFDDGRRLSLFLGSRKDFYQTGTPSPSWMACLHHPDGTESHAQRRCRPDEFLASADCFDVCVGDGLRAKGDLGQQELWFSGADLSGHLRYVAQMRPGRIGDGTLFLDNDPARYVGWLCVAAKAGVSGTLTVHGETARVRGIGYHDHMWGTTPLSGLVREWHWLQFDTGLYTVQLYEAVAAHGNGRVRMLMIGRDGDWLVSTSRHLDLVLPLTSTADERRDPQRLSMTWSDAGRSARVTVSGVDGALLRRAYRQQDDHIDAAIFTAAVRVNVDIDGTIDTHSAHCQLYHGIVR